MSDRIFEDTQITEAVYETEDSLLEQILAETELDPYEDEYDLARQGVQLLLAELLKPDRAGVPADRVAIDVMIAEIDARLSAQVNEILHHPSFQQLESAWRGLRFLIDRVDFHQNIRIELLNASKDDLAADLADAADLTKSGFFQRVYSAEYGQFGGEPYGVICAYFAIGPAAPDMQLLSLAAAVAAMAHAPFIANAAPEFFGEATFDALPRLRDIKTLLEGPQFTKWRSFRDNPDSAYTGLCLPRFLLRPPYSERDNPVKLFNFTEDVIDRHENYLWGHSSVALVERIAESFAHYRWCPNIIGPISGGTVVDLPLHVYESMGRIQTRVPTEVLLTERREFDLSEEGFIALTFRKDTDNACFFSANSPQKPKYFGAGEENRATETNFKLGTQLPYMFIVTRLAHYMKVMQREQLGSFKDRKDLERELNDWIRAYISDMESPAPRVRARRPLRRARITVEDVEGQPGWYACRLEVQPHMKYMGASFTLSLVGRLDK